jgi:parvulin-like peptidyl-prolyl isomerase
MKKTLAAVTLLFTLFITPSAAQIADRIIAVVNRDVITLTELNESFAPLRERIMKGNPGPAAAALLEQARREHLDKKINDLLIEQAARASGISVREEEITAVITDMLTRRRMTQEALTQELAREGTSMEEYRQSIRDHLIRMKLIRREVRAKIIITPEEIGRFYEKYRHEYEGELEVRLAQILLPFPGGTDARLEALLREDALEIRRRVAAGESLENFAARHSRSGVVPIIQDIGFVGRGIMHRDLEEAAFALGHNEVSDIIHTPRGLHLLRVLDRRGGGTKPLEVIREELRQRLEEEKLEKLFDEWIQTLRNRAFIDIRI